MSGLALELLDEKGKRIGANFVNLVVRRRPVESLSGLAPVKQQPSSVRSARVEVLGPRLVAVRFDPGDLAAFRTDRPDWEWLENRGKFYGYGRCEVEYHLVLPEFIRDAMPAQVALMAELATKADDQRLDWPAVRQPLDYPQTQQRRYPGKVSVWLSSGPETAEGEATRPPRGSVPPVCWGNSTCRTIRPTRAACYRTWPVTSTAATVTSSARSSI